MKTIRSHKQKNIKSIVIWASLLGVLILALGTYFLFIKPQLDSAAKKAEEQSLEIKDRPVGDVNYDAPTVDEQNPTLDPPAKDPEPGSEIPASITYAGGSPLQIRVLINEVISSGTCKLEITKGSSNITSQSVDIFNAANSTTCKGFTVDSALVSGGIYKITVTVTSGDRQGVSSKEINL